MGQTTVNVDYKGKKARLPLLVGHQKDSVIGRGWIRHFGMCNCSIQAVNSAAPRERPRDVMMTSRVDVRRDRLKQRPTRKCGKLDGTLRSSPCKEGGKSKENDVLPAVKIKSIKSTTQHNACKDAANGQVKRFTQPLKREKKTNEEGRGRRNSKFEPHQRFYIVPSQQIDQMPNACYIQHEPNDGGSAELKKTCKKMVRHFNRRPNKDDLTVGTGVLARVYREQGKWTPTAIVHNKGKTLWLVEVPGYGRPWTWHSDRLCWNCGSPDGPPRSTISESARPSIKDDAHTLVDDATTTLENDDRQPSPTTDDLQTPAPPTLRRSTHKRAKPRRLDADARLTLYR